MVTTGLVTLSKPCLARPDYKWRSSRHGEGLHDPTPSTSRLPNGTRVRLASGVYHVEDQRVVLRVAYSEDRLWRELGEFGEVLLFGFPIAVLVAGFGGYALARK